MVRELDPTSHNYGLEQASELSFFFFFKVIMGFPGGSDGKESACKCRRPGFDPWVGKIPCRTGWQLTLVFLPRKPPWTEEPGELQSMGSKRVGHN